MRNTVCNLLLASPLGLASSTTKQDCKCVPGDSCWPPKSSFDQLNSTVSGRLIQGVPPASVCYESQPNYNSTECEIVTASWFSSSFHANDPISVGWPWWANNSCPPIFPNGTSVTGDLHAEDKGCGIGGYPIYSVNVTEETHVVAAVNFARQHNIRLNVKSTGHSFQGRSTGFGTLSVWTHHMRGFTWHSNFQAGKCDRSKSYMAAIFAAGERGRDVYENTAKHDAVVVAGSAQDVGIVGWFTGGGHGPLSGTYGLGIDNVLEVRIVTPDGVLRTANACQNSDLFWAVRGGGGGTFGIITSVTMRAYPSPQTTRHTFSLSIIDAQNNKGFWDKVADIMTHFPDLKAGGMQGYSVILPPPAAPTWTWGWSFDVHDKPNGTIEALIAPILQKLDPENGTSLIYTSDIKAYPDFFSVWNATIGPESVAMGGAVLGSRLLPTSSLTGDLEHLSRAFQNVSVFGSGDRGVLQAYMIAPSRNDTIDDVSATPAWRSAVLHTIISTGFSDNDAFGQAQSALTDLTYNRVAILKSLAPESGSYLNEGDAFDPNWQYDFWGENYARLREIKQKYDPDTLLWCISCIGSEDWENDGSGRLCKVSWAKGAESS